MSPAPPGRLRAHRGLLARAGGEVCVGELT